jgi:hypothetical protein
MGPTADAVEKRKSLPLPGSEPWPSSLQPVAIPTDLSRLPPTLRIKHHDFWPSLSGQLWDHVVKKSLTRCRHDTQSKFDAQVTAMCRLQWNGR